MALGIWQKIKIKNIFHISGTLYKTRDTLVHNPSEDQCFLLFNYHLIFDLENLTNKNKLILERLIVSYWGSICQHWLSAMISYHTYFFFQAEANQNENRLKKILWNYAKCKLKLMKSRKWGLEALMVTWVPEPIHIPVWNPSLSKEFHLCI